jgi:tetratricopeptide (TPR) repeat protein
MKKPSLILLAALLWIAPPSHAKWTEASSRHFIVYSEAKPKQVRDLAERLERFDQTMRFVHRQPDPELGPANRLTVYVLSGKDQVAKLARSNSVAGFYVGRAGTSLAIVSEDFDGTRAGAEVLLFHEYAHHFLNSNFSIGWPVWLGEGFAEFYSTAQIRSDGGVNIGLPAEARAYNLFEELYQISVSKMLSLPVGARSNDVASMYARGWLLMHYLLFEPSRKGQLETYLAGLGQGKPSAAAGAAAFGDLAKLDREIGVYLERNKFKGVTVPASAIKLDAITLRELSAGENAVMPLKIRSRRGVNAQQAAELAPRMRAAAAAFAGDAAVQAALAEAEFDAGNFDAALAAADRALAADAKQMDALLYKGRSLAKLAQRAGTKDDATWREVRTWFLSANRVDPEDPRSLIHFYESFAASGAAPTANSVAGLNRALELAPQDKVLRMQVALQSLIDGEVARARQSLALVAANAHAGELGTKAGAILEKLDQEGAAAALELLKKPDEAPAAAP